MLSLLKNSEFEYFFRIRGFLPSSTTDSKCPSAGNHSEIQGRRKSVYSLSRQLPNTGYRRDGVQKWNVAVITILHWSVARTYFITFFL